MKNAFSLLKHLVWWLEHNLFCSDSFKFTQFQQRKSAFHFLCILQNFIQSLFSYIQLLKSGFWHYVNLRSCLVTNDAAVYDKSCTLDVTSEDQVAVGVCWMSSSPSISSRSPNSSVTRPNVSPLTSDSLNNSFSPLDKSRPGYPVTQQVHTHLHTQTKRVRVGMSTWTFDGGRLCGVGGLFYVAVWEVRGIIDCYNWCPLISWQHCSLPRG